MTLQCLVRGQKTVIYMKDLQGILRMLHWLQAGVKFRSITRPHCRFRQKAHLL